MGFVFNALYGPEIILESLIMRKLGFRRDVVNWTGRCGDIWMNIHTFYVHLTIKESKDIVKVNIILIYLVQTSKIAFAVGGK